MKPSGLVTPITVLLTQQSGSLTHYEAGGYPPGSKIFSAGQELSESLRGTPVDRTSDPGLSAYGHEHVQCRTILERRTTNKSDCDGLRKGERRLDEECADK